MTATTSRPAQIANVILQQLGGQRFCTMTGAKDMLATGDGLQFKVGRNAMNVTAVVVTLDVSDLYTVQCYTGRGLSMKPAGEPVTMVDAASLRGVFESSTGLRTSL